MIATIFTLALAAGGPGSDPVAELLHAPAAGPPQVRRTRRYRPMRQRGDRSLFAFDETEVTVCGGMLWFSDDFGADPEPCGGAMIEVPMPWLGHGVLGLPGDAIGLFGSFTASEMDRDFAPPVVEPNGDLVFFNAGLSVSLVRNETWLARLYGGFQYADYGEISDMRDGTAGLAGAGLGVRLFGDVRLTVHSEAVFAHDGDQLVFNYAGLLVEF